MTDSIVNKRTEAVDNLLSLMEDFTPDQITEIITSRQADLRKQKKEEEEKKRLKEAAAADLKKAFERYGRLANINYNIDWDYFLECIEGKTIIIKPSSEKKYMSDKDFWNWLWN